MNIATTRLPVIQTRTADRTSFLLAVGVVLYSRPTEAFDLLFSSIEVASDVLQHRYPDTRVATFIKSGSPVQHPGHQCGFFDKCVDNLGFGISHNRLMREAFFGSESDLYLCLNHDTIVDPYCFVEAYDFFRSNGQNTLFEAVQTPMEHPKPYDPLSGLTPWCSGAAMFISRSVFLQTNGFDENMFMYCEDVDLSWRVRLGGGVCRVLPRARIAHEVALGGAKPREIRRHMLESGRYLGEKWGAPEFVRAMESALVEEGFYPDAVYLPPLRVAHGCRPDPGIVEFRQLLSFCIPRWR